MYCQAARILYDVYRYVFLYFFNVCSYNSEYTDEFMDLTAYSGSLEDFSMDMLALEMVVNDEQTYCGFED